jgi:hypothetical protein
VAQIRVCTTSANFAERKGLAVQDDRQDVDRLNLGFVKHVHLISGAPSRGVLSEATLNVLPALRLQARGHELEMRFSEHPMLGPVEGTGETTAELPVEHVHGLARPQGAAGFEKVDSLGSKQAGHLEVEHPETKRIPIGGATLHEKRENISEELPDRANERY